MLISMSWKPHLWMGLHKGTEFLIEHNDLFVEEE